MLLFFVIDRFIDMPNKVTMVISPDIELARKVVVHLMHTTGNIENKRRMQPYGGGPVNIQCELMPSLKEFSISSQDNYPSRIEIFGSTTETCTQNLLGIFCKRLSGGRFNNSNIIYDCDISGVNATSLKHLIPHPCPGGIIAYQNPHGNQVAVRTFNVILICPSLNQEEFVKNNGYEIFEITYLHAARLSQANITVWVCSYEDGNPIKIRKIFNMSDISTQNTADYRGLEIARDLLGYYVNRASISDIADEQRRTNILNFINEFPLS